MLDIIPYVPLPPEQLQANLKVIRKASNLIRQHSDRIFGPKKRRVFRKKLLANELKARSYKIPKKDSQAILAVKNLEFEMLCGFARLIKKHSFNWWSMSHCFTNGEKDDYCQAASMAFIDALYAYRGRIKKASFITFAWRCIHNRMISYVGKNSAGLFGGMSASNFILLGRFEVEQAKANGPTTVDETIAKMDLNTEDEECLRASMIQIVAESQINLVNSEEDHQANLLEGYATNGDYTRFSVRNRVYREEDKLEPDMWDAIKKAKLTQLETDILFGSLLPYWGWKTDIANNHINPGTGKKWTRQRLCRALPDILAKITERIKSHYGSPLPFAEKK
jgi:hypothetical protein